MLAQYLTTSVPHVIRAKGARYHSMGAVVAISGGEWTAHAVVRGGRNYRVEIARDGDGFRASCDCAYFVDRAEVCKHIWAAVIGGRRAQPARRRRGPERRSLPRSRRRPGQHAQAAGRPDAAAEGADRALAAFPHRPHPATRRRRPVVVQPAFRRWRAPLRDQRAADARRTWTGVAGPAPGAAEERRVGEVEAGGTVGPGCRGICPSRKTATSSSS